MGNFFKDLAGGLFGQQSIPGAVIPSTDDIIATSIANTPKIANATVDYNKILAPGLTQAQLSSEKLYDPRQADLRHATTRSILDQLQLGSTIPKDVQDMVIRNSLEGAAASGFGVTPGGRGLVARDLGLTSLDLLNQRIGTAMNATRSAPSLNQLYQPQGIGMTPGDVADLVLGNAQAQNNYNTFKSTVEANNRKNMWEQPLNLAASAYGSYTGAKALGGATGGGAGGPSISYNLGGDKYRRSI